MESTLIELRGFIQNPRNDEQLLYNRRMYEEFVFKYDIYLSNVENPHTFVSSYGPIQLGHIRDVSNKCTSIYFVEGRTPENNPAIPSVHRYISEQWFEGNIHNKDITFQRFFAKIVLMSQSHGIKQCLQIHRGLCRNFDGHLKNVIFSLKRKESLEVAELRSYDPVLAAEDDDALGTEDHDHSKDYRITSLFRSVIIIMRDWKVGVPTAEQKVLLVRTGIKDGLALSISFDGVEQVEDDDPDFIPPIGSIITTLKEAVALIMRINKSFENMFPPSNERNTGTFITNSGKSVSLVAAKEMELKGREVVGPSTSWVNLNSSIIPHDCYRFFCNASYTEMGDGCYDEESEARSQRESGASIPGPSSQLVISSSTTQPDLADVTDDLFSISRDVL
ncbi:hypothetical protein BCIN_01g00910 [Botrytis cinerea B05.10]|uniref:Uncharacterized protein n=1 Tax=Botryotinia fuckeliana (strain B05.10) TaxID=332648 RepID=A0A384J449_BOTFB|nr:hypothetical protein BCIN_01g00910 [Botrytis cinerea B05.10]ATZ45281.1 hypothetical protein BCIN_01g00910 [Botrytis cinerea B05.10]